jgi:hypothetical protein
MRRITAGLFISLDGVVEDPQYRGLEPGSPVHS